MADHHHFSQDFCVLLTRSAYGESNQNLCVRSKAKDTASDAPVPLISKGNKKSQFRTSLVSSMQFLESFKMTPGIMEKLKATPFWCLLAPIINGEITKKDVRLNSFSMSKILQCYSKEDSGFELGGKILSVGPNDFTTIFGITGGSAYMEINKESAPKRNTKEGDRLMPYFPIGSKLTSAELKIAVMKFAGKTDLSDKEEEDVAILIVLHLLANFFLPGTRSDCPWGWAPFVTDFEKINEWDWATALCEYLTSYLDEGLKEDAQSCHGCVPLIVYAICEHTTVFKPKDSTKFPRYLKWDYSSLCVKVAEAAYRGSQVSLCFNSTMEITA